MEEAQNEYFCAPDSRLKIADKFPTGKADKAKQEIRTFTNINKCFLNPIKLSA